MRLLFMNTTSLPRSAYAAVIVAALGYFVDVYDLVLFGVVRASSLRSLGLNEAEALSVGIDLLNTQMIGMLLGGVLWGVLGDRRGRLSVLFGSIFLYSVANFANAFVVDIATYSVLRFIAGVGLAGELGAGITLVSELLPKDKRGYGTTVVATVGVFGAIAAAFVGARCDWRTSYLIGGILGFLLLFLRISVHESGIFRTSQQQKVGRGDVKLLFAKRERVVRYVNCILIGAPIWFVVGLLVFFSPEIGKALGMTEVPIAGKSIMNAYIGLVIGDCVSGLLSQYLRSRRKAMGIFLVCTCLSIVVYLSDFNSSPARLYLICFPLGFSVGYWAVFVTTAAEQFGTNLRATVATSVPNFVRGSTVLLTMLFELLKPRIGIVGSAGLVASLCMFTAFLSLWYLRESFSNDLEFTER
jgi:MFS family permease